jgi:hypothetical protein
MIALAIHARSSASRSTALASVLVLHKDGPSQEFGRCVTKTHVSSSQIFRTIIWADADTVLTADVFRSDQRGPSNEPPGTVTGASVSFGEFEREKVDSPCRVAGDDRPDLCKQTT